MTCMLYKKDLCEKQTKYIMKISIGYTISNQSLGALLNCDVKDRRQEKIFHFQRETNTFQQFYAFQNKPKVNETENAIFTVNILNATNVKKFVNYPYISISRYTVVTIHACIYTYNFIRSNLKEVTMYYNQLLLFGLFKKQ